jgi:hypothetical protein
MNHRTTNRDAVIGGGDDALEHVNLSENPMPFVPDAAPHDGGDQHQREHRRRRMRVPRAQPISPTTTWTSTIERGAPPLLLASQKSVDIRQWISDSNSYFEVDDDGATVSIDGRTDVATTAPDALSLSRQTPLPRAIAEALQEDTAADASAAS